MLKNGFRDYDESDDDLILNFKGKAWTITYGTGNAKGFLGQDTVKVRTGN